MIAALITQIITIAIQVIQLTQGMVKMQKVIIVICTAGEGNERKTKVK